MRLQHIKAANLTLNNGETVHVELIGKGRFSEAWKNGQNVYVITRERAWGTDYSKRMLEELDSDNPHLPKIELIGELESDRSDVFKMPLYIPLTAKHKQAWAQWKELRRIKEECWSKGYSKYIQPTAMHRARLDNAYLIVQDIAAKVGDSDVLPEDLKDAVRLLADTITDSGRCTWMLEFERKCNLMVDENENLILLDCVFDLEVLNASFKRNRRAGY